MFTLILTAGQYHRVTCDQGKRGAREEVSRKKTSFHCARSAWEGAYRKKPLFISASRNRV